MKKKLFTVVFVWILLLGISFFWNIQASRSNQDLLLVQTARTLFEQMLVSRQWNASFNGVYVKVTETVKPNPYLKDPERDLACQGFFLTKINPAFMTRQMSELTDKAMGIQFHTAGLFPLRPANQPTAWEKTALESFAKKTAVEKGELVSEGPDTVFMYMKGLTAEPSCLTCHTDRAYVPGDIIGGITVKIFNPSRANLFPIILGHLAGGGIGLVMILFFGIKLINAYRTIQHQAIFDALTQIPNRRYFNERISVEVRQSRRQGTPMCVIMADIDNFKRLNDTYGHARGDIVLARVAGAIKTALKRPVDFCARYGGEEFVVVLPDTDEKGAVHIAGQILEQVRHIRIGQDLPDLRVTVSLGIAAEKNPGPDWEDVIKKADTALYQAKSNGKDRYEIFG